MPNGRGVECNPAVVARLHLFSEGSQVFMINDCGCNSTRHQREVFSPYFSSFFVWLWQKKKKGREGGRSLTEWTGICSSWLVPLLIGFPFHYHSIKAIKPHSKRNHNDTKSIQKSNQSLFNRPRSEETTGISKYETGTRAGMNFRNQMNPTNSIGEHIRISFWRMLRSRNLLAGNRIPPIPRIFTLKWRL
jgi:hypothetical protein